MTAPLSHSVATLALVGALTFVTGAARADAGLAWAPKLPQVGPPCLMGTERLDLRPDGVLRCPALPAEVTFPTGFELRRVEDKAGATLVTVTDGGALAFHYTITTWRGDDPHVVAEIDRAQEQLLQLLTLVQGPKVLSHADATLAGAQRGRVITFTDRQKRVQGEMRTFMLPGFGLTVVALGDDRSFVRPGSAIATAFFASLRVVPPAAPSPVVLAAGDRLAFPEGAYPLRDDRHGGLRQLLYLAPALSAQILVLDVATPTDCGPSVREASEPGALTRLVANAGVTLVLDGAPRQNGPRVQWRGRLGGPTGGDSTAGLTNVGLIRCLDSRDGKLPGSLLMTFIIADNRPEPLEAALERMVAGFGR